MAFLPVLTAVVAAAGTIMSGIAQSQAADYQSKVSANNAALARMSAEKEATRGFQEAQQQDFKNRSLIAKQRAIQSASNLDVNSGSAEDVQDSSRVLGRLDTANVKHASDQKQVALLNQANTFEAEGELARAKGQNSLLSSFFDAGSSLISGGSRFASKWSTWGASTPTGGTTPAWLT
jgi:hypothetical protein